MQVLPNNAADNVEFYFYVPVPPGPYWQKSQLISSATYLQKYRW